MRNILSPRKSPISAPPTGSTPPTPSCDDRYDNITKDELINQIYKYGYFIHNLSQKNNAYIHFKYNENSKLYCYNFFETDLINLKYNDQEFDGNNTIKLNLIYNIYCNLSFILMVKSCEFT